jgi:hypothetical protein
MQPMTLHSIYVRPALILLYVLLKNMCNSTDDISRLLNSGVGVNSSKKTSFYEGT